MIRSKYANSLKREVCRRICEERCSTIVTAEELKIPVKTVENWITAYNKDPHCYDRPDDYCFIKRREYADRYNDLDNRELVIELKRRDTEIEFLRSVILAKELEN